MSLTHKLSVEDRATHLHIQTMPEAVRATRKLARAAAVAGGASEDDAAEIELAVGEALTNASEHAYSGEAGPVDVRIAVDGERLVIEVRDYGRPITPPTIPHAVPPPTRERGRGLYVIKRIMDEVEIIHPVTEHGGTAVRMAKRIV